MRLRLDEHFSNPLRTNAVDFVIVIVVIVFVAVAAAAIGVIVTVIVTVAVKSSLQNYFILSPS